MKKQCTSNNKQQIQGDIWSLSPTPTYNGTVELPPAGHLKERSPFQNGHPSLRSCTHIVAVTDFFQQKAFLQLATVLHIRSSCALNGHTTAVPLFFFFYCVTAAKFLFFCSLSLRFCVINNRFTERSSVFEQILLEIRRSICLCISGWPAGWWMWSWVSCSRGACSIKQLYQISRTYFD